MEDKDLSSAHEMNDTENRRQSEHTDANTTEHENKTTKTEKQIELNIS